jgi:DNA-binding GntR family transcriptional regulator
MTSGAHSTTNHTAQGPIVRRLTSDLVAERIRNLVFDGKLKPGDRVDQEVLAEELGVSRLPVREAVRTMAQDGLLSLEPHTGAFVGEFNEFTLRDHFEIVGLVEGLAAGRVATQRDPDVLVRLEDLVQQVREADAHEVRDLNWEFLRVINRAGGSDRLRAVLRSLMRMLPVGLFVQMPGGVDAQRAGVQRIWHAIMTGDADSANRAAVQVMKERAELVIATLRDRGVLVSTTNSSDSDA